MTHNEQTALDALRSQFLWMSAYGGLSRGAQLQIKNIKKAITILEASKAYTGTDVKDIDDDVIRFVDDLTQHQDLNPMLVGLWYAKVQSFVNYRRITAQPKPVEVDITALVGQIVATWGVYQTEIDEAEPGEQDNVESIRSRLLWLMQSVLDSANVRVK